MAAIPRDNHFYSQHYHHLIIALMVSIVLLMAMVGVVLYEIVHKPLPVFTASSPIGESLTLTPNQEPNLLPDTILRWASKAATAAYTFDFVNYKRQILAARPYFTVDGWNDYLRSVDYLITNIVQNRLFINGIVSGTPVFSNQGPLPGRGFVWRIQIPFLVTYQSANVITPRNFIVVITIIRVPTSINPQGIGIDQFVMVGV